MTEFVGGVLGVGDPGTDFLVVLPPRPFLTHFRLVSRGVGWRSWDGERVFAYTVDNSLGADKRLLGIMTRRCPLPWVTHLQLAQFFVSLLVSTLSQKEHWIGVISEPGEGVVAVSEKGRARGSVRWKLYRDELHIWGQPLPTISPVPIWVALPSSGLEAGLQPNLGRIGGIDFGTRLLFELSLSPTRASFRVSLSLSRPTTPNCSPLSACCVLL